MVRPNSKISYFEFHIRKLEKRPIRKSEESIWSKLATPLPGVRGGGERWHVNASQIVASAVRLHSGKKIATSGDERFDQSISVSRRRRTCPYVMNCIHNSSSSSSRAVCIIAPWQGDHEANAPVLDFSLSEKFFWLKMKNLSSLLHIASLVRVFLMHFEVQFLHADGCTEYRSKFQITFVRWVFCVILYAAET